MSDEIKNVNEGMELVCPIHFRGEKKDDMYEAAPTPGQSLYSMPLNLHQHEMMDFMNSDEEFIVQYMALPTNIVLVSIKLWETDSSYAEITRMC